MDTLKGDAAKATVMTLRREIVDLRNRCDELFHALACALAVPIDAESGDAVHRREQRMLDWARSFMGAEQALQVAHVAAHKYVQNHEKPCHHDWHYDNHRGGMLCDNCGEFVSDQL